MKQHLTSLALGALLVLSLGAAAQESRQASTLEERVQTLEAQLEATREELRGLAQAAATEAAALDEVHDYLAAVGRSAEAMAKTLDRAEQQGFVAGINYPSRETLLRGWREQLSTLGQGVPGGKPAAVQRQGAPRGGRR
jgi:hypothetical protein